jgi:hypothetical protein
MVVPANTASKWLRQTEGERFVTMIETYIFTKELAFHKSGSSYETVCATE